MGCLRLTYDNEPNLFLQEQEEKVEAVGLRVWINPDGVFSEVGINVQIILQAGIGDYLLPSEKHFNGSLGLIGAALAGYDKIPNDVKRAYAYKLSKLIGQKSGQIFQGAKSFGKTASKISGKLGVVGTLLTVGVIGYEVQSNTWDAHTVVNGALLVTAGVATFFAAPAVLMGIAAYGIGDYFFDFSGSIDSAVGRKSELWK